MKNLIKLSLTSAALSGLMISTGNAADKKAPGKKSPAPEAKKAEDAGGKKVRCFGINTCAGKSECSVKGANDCGGKNSCKGKGWITVAMSECSEKHGEVLEGAPEHHK